MEPKDANGVINQKENEVENEPLNTPNENSKEHVEQKPQIHSENASSDANEETLCKQRKDIREYRRLQHERWRKKSRSSKPSSKSLCKSVVSSLTSEGTDENPYDMPGPSESATADVTEVISDRSGPRRHRHKRHRRPKRPRPASEGDTKDLKRIHPQPSAASGACASPEVIDVEEYDGAFPDEKQGPTDNGTKDTNLEHQDDISIRKQNRGKEKSKCSSLGTEVNQSDADNETDEEIMCLGVYSRKESKTVIDLTESPSPQSEEEQSTLNEQAASTGNQPNKTPNQSTTPASTDAPGGSCDYGNSSNQPQALMHHGGVGAGLPFGSPVSPHEYPFQPVIDSSNSAFTNFLTAAVFGNAVNGPFPGLGAPLLNPVTPDDAVLTGVRGESLGFPALHNSAQNNDASSLSTSTSQPQRSTSLLRNRQWSHILQPIKSWDVMDFTVMSYNILAQNLLASNMFLYGQSQSEWLSWDYRSQNLLREISEHSPDIICLQEVYADHYFDFFQPRLLAQGYKGCFKCRTRSMKDGCATFFKDRLFILEKSTPVEYFNPNVLMLDRDNIALILTLLPKGKNSNVKLIVSNTHLLFNPKRGDVKLAQLMVLLSEVDRLARIDTPSNHPASPRYHPTILTGDFNTEPLSPIYRLLATGSVAYEHEIISDFSGQEEGMRYGTRRCFNKEIIPGRVGISDCCQYVSEVRWRLELWKNSFSSCQQSTIGTSLAPQEPVAGPSAFFDSEPLAYLDEGSLLNQCSGVLSTFLPLVSVYRHSNFCPRTNKYEDEVTTHHGRANCTVDYIFYTVKSRSTKVKGKRVRLKKVQEDRLRLTKRLSLLSDREMERDGPLPNKDISSDHIALLAGFQLKLA